MANKVNIAQRISLYSLMLMAAACLVVPFLGGVKQIKATSYPLTPPITPPVTPPFTLTPTPTLPPTVNHLPKIIVSSKTLPIAKPYSNFYANITGYDLDSLDNLTLTITNLPPGLSQGLCTTFMRGTTKFIQCNIIGKATKAGKYQPLATIRDNRGGAASEKFFLTVAAK